MDFALDAFGAVAAAVVIAYIGTTKAAIDLCRKLKLEGMELVLKFDMSAHNMSLPIELADPGTEI